MTEADIRALDAIDVEDAPLSRRQRHSSTRLFTIAWSVALAWFVVFGIVFLNVPGANNDEGWIIARATHLLKTGHLGDPILPASVAPVLSRLFDAGIVSPAFGWLYYAGAGLGVALGIPDEYLGFRLGMFLWAALTVLLTQVLARRVGLGRRASFGAAAMLCVVPEFLLQTHIERPEIMLAASVALSLILAYGVLVGRGDRPSPTGLALLALFAWAPSILVHPSGICIPIMLGCLYLVTNWRRFWSWPTALFIGLMVPGALLFVDMIVAPGRAAGGEFGVMVVAPPILSRGVWWFAKSPLHFHQRMFDGGALSQLASTLWYLSAFASMLVLWRTYRDSLALFLATAAASVIVSLMLLSGSTGAFNVLAAPACAIAIARLVERASADLSSTRRRRTAGFASVMLVAVCIVAVIPSIVLYQPQYEILVRLKEEVRSIVPESSSVMAPALYYPALSDRRFVSNSWFTNNQGRVNQSFEEGFATVDCDYLVLDDFSLSIAISERSAAWAHEMMEYVDRSMHRVAEIPTRYYLKPNYVMGGIDYPKSWGEVTPGYLTHVRVYRRRDVVAAR